MLKTLKQEYRILMQQRRQVEKAAKDENKLRMQQRNLRAKEGKLPLQYYLIIFLHLFYFHSCGSTQL